MSMGLYTESMASVHESTDSSLNESCRSADQGPGLARYVD
jgi:hypothetical protein